MSNSPDRVTTAAVVGAGIAGAACAAGLMAAGVEVTLFDKSRGPGGRMATRRVQWAGADGQDHVAEFDHGAPLFAAQRPRFRATVARAQAAGVVRPWRPRLHAGFQLGTDLDTFVPQGGMPAFARHLARNVPLQAGRAVQRLQRAAQGWQLVLDGEPGGALAGPFDLVMLALPAPQAAVLLAGHHDGWADAMAAVPMLPCWTLMAATDEVDWPWDAAEPPAGPLAWVLRQDRKPGRGAPAGIATWVAHATPAWSADHLEAEPRAVAEALQVALGALVPAGAPLHFHHAGVHRWRYAVPAAPVAGGGECGFDAALGLGVCGDMFGNGQVESAWRSGDELADTVASVLEAAAGEGAEAGRETVAAP